MTEIINRIFSENNYMQLINFKNGDFFMHEDENVASFYIVKYIDGTQMEPLCIYKELMSAEEEYITEETSRESFNKGLIVKNLQRENKGDKIKQIDKNMSIIFLLKLESSTDIDLIKNAIYAIEESSNYFKRYVLTYVEKQMIDFNKLIIDNPNKHINKIMSEICSDKIEYGKLSKGENINSLYEFGIKLFAKVPFLKYDFQAVGIPKTLEERIQEHVSSEEHIVGKYLQTIKENDCSIKKLMEIGLECVSEADIDLEISTLLKE